MTTVVLHPPFHLLFHHHRLKPPAPPHSLCSPGSRLSFSSSTSQPLASPPQQKFSDEGHALIFSPDSGINSFAPSILEDFDVLFDRCLVLLRLSVQHNDIGLARAVQGCILKFEESTQMGNALIMAYTKLGLLQDAYLVFEGLSCPDVVSYTALISAFAKSNEEYEAMEVFMRMRSAGIEPNERSFVAVLTACIRILDLELGSKVHALAIKTAYLDNVYVANALMGLYGRFDGWLDCVMKVFYEMPQRDVVSWNTVISSLVREQLYTEAFYLFHCMLESCEFGVDYFSISAILAACAGHKAWMQGREIHAHAIRAGLENNLSVNNALIRFYTKCGRIHDVVVLFNRIPVRDVFTWTEMVTAYMEFGFVDSAVEVFGKMEIKNSISYNALLSGFCKNGEGSRALELFIKMIVQGLELTGFSLTSVISACTLLKEQKISEQIHGFCIKCAFGSSTIIRSALLDMCTRCERMADAVEMFDRWPLDQNNSRVCTSIFSAHASNGQPEEALSFLHGCLLTGRLTLDEVAFSSIFGVCGTLGFYEMGKQIHCLALKTGYVNDVGVSNSMISMYSKCGNLSVAIKIFNAIPVHDTVSWNALIAGHLLHRKGDEAFALWSKIDSERIRPDEISLILLISAYAHTKSNLIDECRKLFVSLRTVYGIEPTFEHYAAFVGVLGRWGCLEEAEELVSTMHEPKVTVWRTLLDSCRLHSDSTIGKRVAKRILMMEPQDPSTYILVSNLYSASGRWHCAESVREHMREKGFQKHPSRSWVINQNKIHSFYARDRSHPLTKDIYSALEILILECLRVGYVPDTSFVLHEVEEHQKKDFLFFHSAKLAATYQLLNSHPSKPIRVVKNILLCGDCHTFLKHVSLVTQREIFVRDSSGFHCFLNGSLVKFAGDKHRQSLYYASLMLPLKAKWAQIIWQIHQKCQVSEGSGCD